MTASERRVARQVSQAKHIVDQRDASNQPMPSVQDSVYKARTTGGDVTSITQTVGKHEGNEIFHGKFI